MHGLRLVGTGILAGTDRPHGLVGHHRPGKGSHARQRQHRLELAADDRLGRTGLALVQGLPDAEDRHEPLAENRPELAGDHRIVFPVMGPALAVTDDHVFAADVLEHGRRRLAGEGATGLGRDVLGAYPHRCPLQAANHVGQVDERRADQHLRALVPTVDAVDQLLDQHGVLGGRAVHLPVTGD